MNMNTALSGEYNLVITKPDGSTTETGWFKNLILDQGLDRIGQSVNVITFCHIGTGTTTPATGQIGLSAFTAAGAYNSGLVTVTNSGSPLYSSLHTVGYVFAQGAVVGNMAELGVGWAASGNVLFSRALITDGDGNPTALTLTSIDQLTVYYRLNFSQNLTDITGSVTLGVTPYDYVGRITNATSIYADASCFLTKDIFTVDSGWTGMTVYPATSVLGEITGAPSGGGTPVSVGSGITQAVVPYGLGNLYRDVSYTLAIGSGNTAGGIGALVPNFSNSGGTRFQYKFTPAIPKTASTTLTLIFRITWSRA